MTETNVILKVQTFSLSDPLITVELVMDRRHQAIDIADKLNDIAKAKKENTTMYFVQTIDLPNGREDNDDDMPF